MSYLCLPVTMDDVKLYMDYSNTVLGKALILKLWTDFGRENID